MRHEAIDKNVRLTFKVIQGGSNSFVDFFAYLASSVLLRLLCSFVHAIGLGLFAVFAFTS